MPYTALGELSEINYCLCCMRQHLSALCRSGMGDCARAHQLRRQILARLREKYRIEAHLKQQEVPCDNSRF